MKVTLNTADRFGAITFEEEALPEASPTLSLSNESGEARHIYIVDFENQAAAVAALLPKISYAEDSFESVTYAAGHLSFTYAALNMRCVRVEVEPVGKSTFAAGNNKFLTWAKARLRATYKPAPETLKSLLYEESLDPSIEFVTMPHRKLYWDAAGTAEPIGRDEAPGRAVQIMRWGYTLKGMLSLPATVFTNQGMINSVAITSLTFKRTFPIGTLLYRAPNITPSIGRYGHSRFNITLEFVARLEGPTENTWNKAYKAATAALQPLYSAAGGGVFSQYTAADLRDLLIE